MCGLLQDILFYDIGDNFDFLKGFFVKKIGDVYKFYYDFVMEVISFIFGKDYLVELI